jgi:hypothetical protein
MTNPAGFDFTKFVPGFDFLKNLTPGGGTAASSTAPGWVAPTLDPEELDKRIQELKTVQFWLEQNTKAVAATIQALEVQRMTLNTLKGMNMSFNDLAESLKVKPQEAAAEPAKPKYTFTQAESAHVEPEAQQEHAAEPKAAKAKKPRSKKASAAAGGVDPSHWWGALTDQFQHIATHAMNDMAHRANAHAAAHGAPKAAKPAAKKAAARKPLARKAAPRKTASGKTTARKTASRKTATKSKR